jgi:hypothetical protein
MWIYCHPSTKTDNNEIPLVEGRKEVSLPLALAQNQLLIRMNQ